MTRHVYEVIVDGRVTTAVHADTDFNNEARAWQATDDLGAVTVGRPDETRHDVALRSLMLRLNGGRDDRRCRARWRAGVLRALGDDRKDGGRCTLPSGHEGDHQIERGGKP